MSKFLDKYNHIRRLGKGAYGEVFLVEDDEQKKYALKVLSVRAMEKQPYLFDYLDSQIESMGSMESPYIIRISIYILLEYCDGGDLMNIQAKQKGNVFALDDAVSILSEVIKGLQFVHRKGYLHRDIKSQNILLKNQNNIKYYKLADFGFCTKRNRVGGTVLGTQQYMSPQIFSEEDYGFEIDMWAFGVLFYHMLNMQYPFHLNAYWTTAQKKEELQKLSKNFNFSEAVQKSSKKQKQNCSPNLDDLFKRIFDPNPKTRINFAQIRLHPIFQKYFKVVQNSSKILYKKGFQNSRIQPLSPGLRKTKTKMIPVQMTPSKVIKLNKAYEKQEIKLRKWIEKIDFIFQNGIDSSNILEIPSNERNILGLSFFKCYIIESKKLKDKIDQLNNPKQISFKKTAQFNQIIDEIHQVEVKALFRYKELRKLCLDKIKQTSQACPKFETAFLPEIEIEPEKSVFKKVYRCAIYNSYSILKKQMKDHNVKQNRINQVSYFLTLLAISYAYQQLFDEQQKNCQKLFQKFFNDNTKIKPSNIYLHELRNWIKGAGKKENLEIVKNIVTTFFK